MGGSPMDAQHAPDAERRADRVERLAACLVRAKEGDLTALDPVVAELNPLLWHVARSQGLTAEDAADVVQTTWLELVRQLHDIRSPQALIAWLVTATRREAWHVIKRQRRESGPVPELMEGSADQAPDMEERLEADE